MTLDLLVNVEANIFSIELIVTLILLVCGVILFARDYKVGLISNFLIFSGCFIIFYEYGLNYRIPLMVSIGFIILISLSLYTVNKTVTRGFVG